MKMLPIFAEYFYSGLVIFGIPALPFFMTVINKSWFVAGLFLLVYESLFFLAVIIDEFLRGIDHAARQIFITPTSYEHARDRRM